MASDALIGPPKTFAWWFATLSQDPAESETSGEAGADYGKSSAKLTEVIRHHVPEIEILIHFADEELPIIVGAARGSDLHGHERGV